MRINRVALLYEITIIYQNLSSLGKFCVANYFQFGPSVLFQLPEDERDVKIFKKIVERDLYYDFKRVASQFNKRGALYRN